MVARDKINSLRVTVSLFIDTDSAAADNRLAAVAGSIWHSFFWHGASPSSGTPLSEDPDECSHRASDIPNRTVFPYLFNWVSAKELGCIKIGKLVKFNQDQMDTGSIDARSHYGETAV